MLPLKSEPAFVEPTSHNFNGVFSSSSCSSSSSSSVNVLNLVSSVHGQQQQQLPLCYTPELMTRSATDLPLTRPLEPTTRDGGPPPPLPLSDNNDAYGLDRPAGRSLPFDIGRLNLNFNNNNNMTSDNNSIKNFDFNNNNNNNLRNVDLNNINNNNSNCDTNGMHLNSNAINPTYGNLSSSLCAAAYSGGWPLLTNNYGYGASIGNYNNNYSTFSGYLPYCSYDPRQIADYMLTYGGATGIFGAAATTSDSEVKCCESASVPGRDGSPQLLFAQQKVASTTNACCTGGYDNFSDTSLMLPSLGVASPSATAVQHPSVLFSALAVPPITTTNNNAMANSELMTAMMTTANASASLGSDEERHVRNTAPSYSIGSDRKRMLFTPFQTSVLESTFWEHKKFINAKQRDMLALRIGLSSTQVKIWFQNRRYKEKKLKKDELFMAEAAARRLCQQQQQASQNHHQQQNMLNNYGLMRQ